jgi:hypothetical protein
MTGVSIDLEILVELLALAGSLIRARAGSLRSRVHPRHSHTT